jgi:hypothetical protein
MLTDLTPSTHSLQRYFIGSKGLSWLDAVLGIPSQGMSAPLKSSGDKAIQKTTIAGYALRVSNGVGDGLGRLDNSHLLGGIRPLRTYARAGPLG